MLSFPNLSKREKQQVSDWYDVIDLMRRGDLQMGLERARLCSHPDAMWFASLFVNVVTVDKAQMAKVLLAKKGDCRAPFFVAVVNPGVDNHLELVLASAVAGYAPAQVQYGSIFGSRSDNFRHWIEKAAAQCDRFALFYYSWILEYVDSPNWRKGKGLLYEKAAAELGHGPAQYYFAKSLHCCDWERYFWLDKSAKRDRIVFGELITGVQKCLELLDSGDLTSCRALFEIGRICSLSCDLERRTVYGWGWDGDIVPVQRVTALYHAWCKDAKDSIFYWIWLARQFGVVRDIRRLIARRLWKRRASWSETRLPANIAK